MAAVLVIITVVALVALDALLLWLRGRSVVAQGTPVRAFGAVRLPRGLFVGDEHTWARLTESGELRVGVDELLTQAVGEVDRVEIVPTGEQVRRGQRLATVWRMGRRLDLRAPASGTVIASNSALAGSPGLIGSDPYGSGWLVSLWPVSHAEALRELRIGDAALRWLEREVGRLADYLTRATSPPVLGGVLADGAHPVVGAALALDEDGWAGFAREFTGEEPGAAS